MTNTSLEGHPIALVSPVHYDTLDHITEHGEAVAEKSAAEVMERFGDDLVVVSSTLSRYAESAEVIANFANAPIVTTDKLNDVVDGPTVIDGNLPEFLSHALEGAGVKTTESTAFVWVAPKVIMAAAKDLPPVAAAKGGVKHGEVVSYDPSMMRRWTGALATKQSSPELIAS